MPSATLRAQDQISHLQLLMREGQQEMEEGGGEGEAQGHDLVLPPSMGSNQPHSHTGWVMFDHEAPLPQQQHHHQQQLHSALSLLMAGMPPEQPSAPLAQQAQQNLPLHDQGPDAPPAGHLPQQQHYHATATPQQLQQLLQQKFWAVSSVSWASHASKWTSLASVTLIDNEHSLQLDHLQVGESVLHTTPWACTSFLHFLAGTCCGRLVASTLFYSSHTYKFVPSTTQALTLLLPNVQITLRG